MLEAAIPKITDISSIKGISTLLALPMLCIAYFLSTGATIDLGSSVHWSLESGDLAAVSSAKLILMFVLKSLWISLWGALLYGLLSWGYLNTQVPFLQLASVLMISIALFYLLCASRYPQLKAIDPFWQYALIVWGVFLQAMTEQIDATQQKIEAEIKDRAEKRRMPASIDALAHD